MTASDVDSYARGEYTAIKKKPCVSPCVKLAVHREALLVMTDTCKCETMHIQLKTGKLLVIC